MSDVVTQREECPSSSCCLSVGVVGTQFLPSIYEVAECGDNTDRKGHFRCCLRCGTQVMCASKYTESNEGYEISKVSTQCPLVLLEKGFWAR